GCGTRAHGFAVSQAFGSRSAHFLPTIRIRSRPSLSKHPKANRARSRISLRVTSAVEEWSDGAGAQYDRRMANVLANRRIQPPNLRISLRIHYRGASDRYRQYGERLDLLGIGPWSHPAQP